MTSPLSEWAPEQALELLPAIEQLARAAGQLILEVYASDFEVQRKADHSPVTLADQRAEALITSALQALRPTWPVVAEEATEAVAKAAAKAAAEAAAEAAAKATANEAAGKATKVAANEATPAAAGVAMPRGLTPAAARTFWLVDPLDGTREFVARNGEFTVNIALIHAGAPVLGVVLLPVSGRLFSGVVGHGAWEQGAGEQAARRALRVRAVPADGLCVAASRSHSDEMALQAFLQRLMQGQPAMPRVASRISAGSSLKFGLLAAGQADVYPRFGRTMEWDTAAGHAVLAAAGGSVCTLDGQPLRYGKPGYENPHFVAWGSRTT